MSDRDYAAEMAMLARHGVSITVEGTGEWFALKADTGYSPLCESGVFSHDPYVRGASFPTFAAAYDAAVEACRKLEASCD